MGAIAAAIIITAAICILIFGSVLLIQGVKVQNQERVIDAQEEENTMLRKTLTENSNYTNALQRHIFKLENKTSKTPPNNG